MENALRDKLLKLYELAKRGVGGEKVNADTMLRRMLEKHSLTIEDIDVELPKRRYYHYTTLWKEKLICQIICAVTNSNSMYTYGAYKDIGADVTDFQHIQILEMIDFHFENYIAEKKKFLDDFASAYVQKHELYRETTDKDREDKPPLTPEEIRAIMRMSSIQESLSNATYHKKLNA